MPAQSKRVQAQPMFDIVLEKPLSQFSEALRSVKVASDLSAILKTKKVTGFVSIQWGSTKIDVVRHALSNAPELYERLLGIILNKVDMTALGQLLP
jgi:hypothetical protein